MAFTDSDTQIDMTLPDSCPTSHKLQIPGLRVPGHPDRDREPREPRDGGGSLEAAAALLSSRRRPHHAGGHLQRLHGQARDAGAPRGAPGRHLPHPRQVTAKFIALN